MQIPSRTKARRGAELLEDYNRPQVVQHSPLSPASSAVDMMDVQEICRILSYHLLPRMGENTRISRKIDSQIQTRASS